MKRTMPCYENNLTLKKQLNHFVTPDSCHCRGDISKAVPTAWQVFESPAVLAVVSPGHTITNP